jgi:hypothetical protein
MRRDSTLRLSLQECRSRSRLAAEAIGDFREVLLQAARPMAIDDLVRLIGVLDGILRLLTGQEGGLSDADK